ncbi:MAG: hypothetical protein JWO38_602 [Gemmataceae bacterium]|nr:hypothetical protein [Gemmataceae bacterium]
MRPITVAVVLLFVSASAAVAQDPPAAGWPTLLPITAGPPPAPPITDYLPVRVVEAPPSAPDRAPGQQHWVSVNLLGGQPSAVRAGVKVWARENNSLWLEAYTGSALYDYAYGFGARVQHTTWSFGTGDTIMVGPGVGGQVLPEWYADLGYRNRRGRWVPGDSHDSPLYFLTGDVDVSWLHDFTPRCGFELGLKVGLAARVGGTVGNCYPRDLMWGKSLYPIIGAYTGLRF